MSPRSNRTDYEDKMLRVLLAVGPKPDLDQHHNVTATAVTAYANWYTAWSAAVMDIDWRPYPVPDTSAYVRVLEIIKSRDYPCPLNQI